MQTCQCTQNVLNGFWCNAPEGQSVQCTFASRLASVARLSFGQQLTQGLLRQVAVESLDAKAFKFLQFGLVCAFVHRHHQLGGILGVGTGFFVGK